MTARFPGVADKIRRPAADNWYWSPDTPTAGLPSAIGQSTIGKAAMGQATIGKATIGKATIGKAAHRKRLPPRCP
jgi:hypothetical protein